MSPDTVPVKPELEKTYLAVIKNSVGTKMFQSFFAQVEGKSRNIMLKGKFSCAFFVSTICMMFGFCRKVHGTVNGVVKDLMANGWKPVKNPIPGCILIWEEYNGHKHIGFFIGNKKAISNSTIKKSPQKHHWTFGIKKGIPGRRVESILSLTRLEK